MLLGLSHVKQLHSLFIMSIIRLIVAKKMYEILLLLICRRDLINVFLQFLKKLLWLHVGIDCDSKALLRKTCATGSPYPKVTDTNPYTPL